MPASLIIPAAGCGSRFAAAMPKQFHDLAGKPILAHSLVAFAGTVSEAVIAASPDARKQVEAVLAGIQLPYQVRIVDGGATRMHSVAAGLQATDAKNEIILVHDAVRPLVPKACVEACVKALKTRRAALVAVTCSSTVKRAPNGVVETTVKRDDLWLAQTPQGFHRGDGIAAFEKAIAGNWNCSDDAEVLERAGIEVTIVPGDARNIKITTPDDLALAEALMRRL